MLNGNLFVPDVVDKLVRNVQKYDGNNETFDVSCNVFICGLCSA